ncbi:general transcription factor 3C polypeptide 1 isoform X1 [Neodiprion virginianus]|uniref:general transcription factor 3C polypeptide 1 isoform X1 n=1 Tax=Neodiprion virginianus TaxID=2961670 RepID=UPI001EE6FD8C|nr:general transcription factor 3C polypeptide 1 isoform X1 [Neodiprion virginianus]
MVSYSSINIVDVIIDEIALEGLDGITLEALWQRLSLRLHDPPPLSKPFMEQVWSICIEVDGIDYYKLEAPRNKLIIFDRYEHIDPDLGTILEPDEVPEDIYPHCPIDDVNAGIKGSCSTYNSRKQISEYVRALTVHQAAEEFGESLVLVASQDIREHALTGNGVCPTLELTVMQYCFLERVGRSRYQGEVTQGKISLASLKEDPKSLFYHRKILLDHKLITKQIHHQKTGGHSCNGSLLHLPRFYVERKPKIIYLAEKVIEILKSKENCVAEYDEIKKELQIENSIKKLFRTNFFLKVVKTDLRVPYRTVYPKAEKKEWQQKNNPTKEKTVRVVQLQDPEMDVSELWGKDEIIDDEETYELDISELKLNVPLLKQANRIVELSGPEGISQCQLAKCLGQTKLQARTMLRNLVKLKIVATYMNDVGRQRVTKFVSKRFEKTSQMSRQFEHEMDKIKKLTRSIDTNNQSHNDSVIPKTIVEPKKIVKTESKCFTMEDPAEVESNNGVSSNDNVKVEEKPTDKNNSDIYDSSVTKSDTREEYQMRIKFRIVNLLLVKYGLSKVTKKYKRTYINIAEQDLFSRYPKSVLSQTVSVKKDQKSIERMKHRIEEQSKNELNSAVIDQTEVNVLCDSIEVKLVEQRPQHRLGRPTSQIIGFMEELDLNEKKNISSITYRLLRRANMIIEAVKEHKVIDDLTKLIKMINEEEDREGYDVKIDKKSIVRLLQKLVKDNVVKNIKLTLSNKNREKNITFICDPSIGIDHSIIQSAVEQAKIKFCLIGSQKVRAIMQKQAKEEDESTKLSVEDIQGLEAFNPSKNTKFAPVNLKYDFKAGKRYGYSPKFVRMKELHLFLFYSIYDHAGDTTVPKEIQVANLRNSGYQIDAKLEQEMSTIYNTEVGWKMFIPPLTRHAGWPLGWTIMCDVLLRIPLSIFVKVHNVPYFIPELETYLNHPIRKHFLVKNLPSQIRNILLMARKYIYNIHESVTRLCYIGLLQFGHQKLKEKDQVFIYLNRRSEITDTTSSAVGYHKVEEKEYPKTSYFFDSLQVVEKYWYDMWNTCINTCLGGRATVEGKDILLEDLNKKVDMIKTAKARNPDEAVGLDIGVVPGDRKGAAGVDSAFFAHLKRNWNWGAWYSNQQYCRGEERKKNEQQRTARLSKIKAKPLKFTEFSGLKKVTGPATQHANEIRKKIHQRQKISDERRSKKQKYQLLVSQHVTRQKSFVRTVLPRKRSVRPRVRYDEVDFCALQQMDKLRVDWSPHEDNILLMCKVAMKYLCPNPRKQMINFTAVRDILRTYSTQSHNKTSRACQRRLVYMFRKPETVNSVALGIEEIKQNFYINKRFGGIVEKLKTKCEDSYEYEEQVVKVFKELVKYIDKRYYNLSDMESRGLVPMPKTIQEFNLVYKIKQPTHQSSLHGFTKDVRYKNEIYLATINSVIHSSMCCGKDKTSWAYELFKVYQQYPETLLRSAMTKIRSDQMVSMKKSYMCAFKKHGNYMPMSSSQYQLSTGYTYKFRTKWPYELFHEARHTIEKFLRWQYENQLENLGYAVPDDVDGIEVGPVTGGLVVGVHDYLTRGQLDFDIEIPDQIIMLDPRLKENDETYIRVLRRYQDILTSLDQLSLKKKQMVKTNLIDPEVEEEDELERREFEDKIVKEKREKEDRDRWNYWKSRNDEISKRLEETEMKAQREKEDKERNLRREAFDRKMKERKNKYAQVLQLGEENVSEAIVSEFRNPVDENAETDTDPDENDVVDDDEDSHIIRFQDGTTITLSKEDIESASWNSDEEDTACFAEKTVQSLSIEQQSPPLKRNRDSTNEEYPDKKRFKSDEDGVSEYEQCHIPDSGVESPAVSLFISKQTDVPLQSNATVSLTKRRIDEIDEKNMLVVQSPKRARIEESSNKVSEHGNEGQNIESQSEIRYSADISGRKSVVHTLSAQSSIGTRVNDLIKKMYCQLGVDWGDIKIEDMNDMQKRCTRIALLLMREENDLAVTDIYHAHDYFIVNTFKIFCSLKLRDTKEPRSLEYFYNMELPADILPLKQQLIDELIGDLKRFALFPKDPVPFEDFLNTVGDQLEITEIDDLRAIYQYLHDKREIGATNKQIISNFKSTSKSRLHRLLSLLTEHRLVLRSGVTTTRYIHQKFTDPWMIKSFKILRLDKESLSPVSDRIISITEKENVVSATSDDCLVKSENTFPSVEEIQTTGESLNVADLDKVFLLDKNERLCGQTDGQEDATSGNDQTPDNKDIDETTGNVQTTRRMRKRTALLQPKDIQKAAKKLDFNTVEPIKVVIKPWIRIDGVLNRRVLDRMLGAVLDYCINHPGITLSKVQKRFVPALQPFQVTELVEMLCRLKCVKIRILRKPKVTLFSKPAKINLKPSTGLDSEDEMIIEPEIDASLKFGMFLGNKTYNIDFLP